MSFLIVDDKGINDKFCSVTVAVLDLVSVDAAKYGREHTQDSAPRKLHVESKATVIKKFGRTFLA